MALRPPINTNGDLQTWVNDPDRKMKELEPLYRALGGNPDDATDMRSEIDAVLGTMDLTAHAFWKPAQNAPRVNLGGNSSQQPNNPLQQGGVSLDDRLRQIEESINRRLADMDKAIEAKIAALKTEMQQFVHDQITTFGNEINQSWQTSGNELVQHIEAMIDAAFTEEEDDDDEARSDAQSVWDRPLFTIPLFGNKKQESKKATKKTTRRRRFHSSRSTK